MGEAAKSLWQKDQLRGFPQFLSALASELGAIGLLGYLAIVASILGTGVRVFRMGKDPQDCWRGIGVIAIMVAYSIPALFDTSLYKPWLPPVYVFVYCGAVAGVYNLRGVHKALDPVQSVVSRSKINGSLLSLDKVRRETG